ncbi:SDR family NAD(P)-dependent oxidoreductase [Novosphingobium beihaiensis]|uniref:SDR family oxidoreductase n=1 Tax=Novosphingobium beihaiensis TaxID=2930389 RepID=A0ABT0BSI2_9SPHN|nr:SDR family oxidoreductase [Novosphingobium beihaiensis]MCJ2187619.1 SDR family oxidoreductase [Novosphingobium beihaiensis]
MTQPMFSLEGKTAIVTGATRGIGRAIAEAYAAAGANVMVSSRKQEACGEVAAAINARGAGKAVPFAANVGSREAVEALVAETRKQFGPVDVLVCNAAANPYYGPMAGISDEQFEKILRTNLLSSHWLAALVAPDMECSGGGSIVLISSMGGLRGSATIGAYNISKAADFQLARNLAVEYGARNICVNCIAPGLIRTDFSRALWEDDGNRAKALAGVPLGRIGEPDDIAGTAVFLASAAARYITGQTIVIDGGMTVTVPGI